MSEPVDVTCAIETLDMHGSSFEVLGVKVSPRSIEQLGSIISSAISTNSRCYIASQNLHGVYTYHRDPGMRQLHNLPNCIVRVDGMPLVWIGRWLGHPIQHEHRVTWIDWIGPLMTLAESNRWRVFFLGGTEDVVRAGVQRLLQRHPRLQLEASSGYFDEGSFAETEKIEHINRYRPHILIVGMGMPRQENWILKRRHALDVPVILTSGAVMEYVAGFAKTPPRWMGALGLEWVYRLADDPKRFWRRYLVEPLALLPLLAHDLASRDRGRMLR